MSDYIPSLTSGPVKLLNGTIRNYKRSRRTQDFMFTENDRAQMGAAAVGAALAGLGGLAVGLASSAMDTSEEADLLEFDLDGKSIRAWVWLSVFKDGDQVEVVAEPMGHVWQGFGIRRIEDSVVALYPHCSRGRVAHYKESAKWFLRTFLLIYSLLFVTGVILMLLRGDKDWGAFINLMMFGGIVSGLIYGFIAYSISRRYLGFTRLAEGIFGSFGWRDVKNIDLPAITKRNKYPGDPGGLGLLYFRVPEGDVKGGGR